MKILGMGGIEFVIILVVVLLIFGPKNLPKLGSALGKTVSNLRSGMNEGKKKKEEEPAPEAESAPDKPEPAELVGEVEETIEYPDAEIVEGAEQAVAEAEAAVDEAFEPKRVKRVVRKKPVE